MTAFTPWHMEEKKPKSSQSAQFSSSKNPQSTQNLALTKPQFTHSSTYAPKIEIHPFQIHWPSWSNFTQYIHAFCIKLHTCGSLKIRTFYVSKHIYGRVKILPVSVCTSLWMDSSLNQPADGASAQQCNARVHSIHGMSSSASDPWWVVPIEGLETS